MISKLLIALVVALICFFIARKAHPIADRSGNDILGQPSDEITDQNTLLKVATFNIQTGKSLDGVRNIQRAAELIDDQHLIGIQEIYAPSWLNKLGFGHNQLDALNHNGAFGQLLSATRHRWFREHRGNAILSRIATKRWRIQSLPDYTGKNFRNMTIVEFEWQGKPVTFINTHLHTRTGRKEQLDIVLAEFAKHPIAILVGDLNSRNDTAALAQALQCGSITDAIADAQLDTQDSEQRIDWILTKGFTVENGKTIAKGISDHPYYEVSLALVKSN